MVLRHVYQTVLSLNQLIPVNLTLHPVLDLRVGYSHLNMCVCVCVCVCIYTVIELMFLPIQLRRNSLHLLKSDMVSIYVTVIARQSCILLKGLNIQCVHCLGSEKSWVRIPPEAAHFSLKKGRWVVSDVVVLFCHLFTFLLSTSVHVQIHVISLQLRACTEF